MLKEFYSYLGDKVIRYFKDRGSYEGERYSIIFENRDQVKGLYNQLKSTEYAKDFSYTNNGQVAYQTFALDFDGQKVIVAETNESIKTDFLTRLRNSVAEGREGFEHTALLIIGDTTIDSLSSATESFQKEGMPFHIDSINADINIILNESQMDFVEKEMIKFDMERRKNDTYKDSSNIFEYSEILAVIHKGKIEHTDYKELRLFKDEELYKQERPKDIQKRLKENNTYFEKVDHSIRFGNLEADLENIFTEKLISNLKKDGWEDKVTYKDVEKAVDEKKNIEKIEIKSIDIYSGDEKLVEDVDYTVMGIGNEKNQTRNKDLLIFNKNKSHDIRVNIHLTKTPDKQSVKVYHGQYQTSRNKIEVKLQNDVDQCVFESIRLDDENTSAKVKVNLCILDTNKAFMEPIITKYKLKVVANKSKCALIIEDEQDVLTLNPKGNEVNKIIIQNHEIYEIKEDQVMLLEKPEGLLEEGESLAFIGIRLNGKVIPLGISDDSKKMTVLTGFSAWKAKIKTKRHLIYKGDNRVVKGTSEYYTRDEFRETLELEHKILDLGGMSWKIKNGEMMPCEIDLPLEVRVTFNELFNFFKDQGLLPSLTYYEEGLRNLAKKYIDSILEAMRDIEDGNSLPKIIQNIVRLGMIEDEDHGNQIKYTPLAPLNVAYQLKIVDVIDEKILENDDLLKKLTPMALVPYVKNSDKTLYKPIEQWHSPEWAYYVPNDVKRYKGSRGFVPKLIKEKLEEFIDHFSYLFLSNHDAMIKINVINTGDCKEILQGICQYYVSELKKDQSIEKINPIQVTIYQEKEVIHAFEEFATYIDIEEIKDKFNLSFETKDRYSERDVVNMLREKITFYNKSINDSNYTYAHLTFVEMNQKSDTGIGKMSEINTGVSLSGIISGVPSVHYSDSYRTGYGMKFIDEKSELIQLTEILNSIQQVAYTSNPYYKDQCITTELDRKDEENLEKIYNTSNWVTFIEPKVDLNFFKTSEVSKDLMIIHYSDQYTTASGYDAITVTRKSRQYQSIIEEHLTQKGVQEAGQFTPDIINMFNAINGDWLLRLISTKSYFDKEKMSILSAVKLSLAYYDHPDIVWVPISLEEILRVSGGAGLKMSDGIFSAKNLGFERGATSDDLMLVGIEERNGEVFIHYHPVEVKIGQNSSSYIDKAIEQAKKTKKIFIDTLMKDSTEIDLKTTIYRNFMMQLVIISIEKLKLYNIWDEQGWDRIINSDIRRKLLNEEYTISRELEEYIGVGAVVSFKKDLQFRHIKEEQDVTVIEFTEEDGINYMTKGISEIKRMLLEDYRDLDQSMFLQNSYKGNSKLVIKEDKSQEDKSQEDNTEESVEIMVKVKDELENQMVVKETPTDVGQESIEILFGTNQSNNQPIIWRPNDTDQIFHTNTGIIGTMGTGKTQFTKSLITQMHRQSPHNLDGKPLGILIFDYKGDYNRSKADFIEATNATVYELYHLPYNPLALTNIENAKPLLPLHTASNLKETLSSGFNLGNIQTNMLQNVIMEAYELKGIHKADRTTWNKPAPTLKDVYNVYINQEQVKQDSLYAALNTLIEFEIFEPDVTKTKPLVELIDGVTVIDLSGYDESVQNLVVAITLDLFYAQMQAFGHSKIEKNIRQLSKIILVDEADNFISKGFNSLKKILKEGREFGVGTILSTQLLSHFSTADNDYSSYILSWIVHNVADLSAKDVRFIFNTQTKSEEEELYNKIKNLQKHYSLVKIGNESKALHMRDKAFWELDRY